MKSMADIARVLVSVACLGGGLLSASRAQAPGERWEGVITVAGMEIPFTVSVQAETAATIDIQGAQGLPLSEVDISEGRIHFELETAIGLAVFDGTAEMEEVTGTFRQGGASGTFVMYPAGAATDPEDATGDEGAVTFSNGDIRLAGTLTMPEGPGPHPAIILITGSGPQNRDEEMFGFRPFRIIAEHLNANGIAVLRYDDRGVGGSTGDVNQATTADFAGDVGAAMDLLRSRSDIDHEAIGLLGHSEGGIVAAMVASQRPDVAFAILVAGTGVSGEQILLEQGELIARSGGASAEQLAAQRASQNAVFAAVRSGEGWAEVEAQLAAQVRASLDAMPPSRRRAIADEDAFVETNVRMQVSFSQTPWFAYFLDHDPSTSLERVQSPVLLLFGELDLQVPPHLNRGPMLAALERAGNADVTERTFPCANHLFLCAETGSPAEYTTLEKQFVDGMLELLSSWIRERI